MEYNKANKTLLLSNNILISIFNILSLGIIL